MYKPVVLVVLDGWGLSKATNGNAIAKANLPTIGKLNKFYPHIALQASGIAVGLPWGEPGNSEVGHITLGAGKILYQNMPRITMAIQNGDFFKNEVLLSAFENAKKNNSAVHLMGLVGKGGVHSYLDHIYALLEMAKNQNFEKVFVHVFTDGRDSTPDSGARLIQELQSRCQAYGSIRIASLCGRSLAMDRDNNWDRIEKAYDLLTKAEGEKITDPIKYLEESYKNGKFDEFIEPAVVTENGNPVATVEENDSVIFFNFREDRAKELTQAFIASDFKGFKREQIKNLFFVTMTQYEKDFPVHVAFFPDEVKDPLGEILSENKLTQLRIAETEKFAHVTYFFNGGIEKSFPNEDRVIVPSQKVETFDKVPEMSAEKITEKVIPLINKYDFILINYANADMVGHTGNEKATVFGVEVIDRCLGQLIPEVIKKNGCLLITADHGNAEEIKNNFTGETDTQHSTNPVPLWFVNPDNGSQARQAGEKFENLDPSGLLSDLAPTVLGLFEIKKPKEMTGEGLLDILK